MRHSRLIASVVFVVLAIVVVTAATRRGDGTPAGPGWRVESSPFRLVFQHDGKDVFGQQPLVDGASGVPRMSYELRGGLGGHHLTGLESSHRAGKAVTYTVATDEDGRTATVVVSSTSRGVSVHWSLSAGPPVKDIFESFATGRDEHFLGTGERRDYVDLRNQAPSIDVNHACAPAPAPYFLSSAGYGVYVRGYAKGRFAFPSGARTRLDCLSGDDLVCGVLQPMPKRAQICEEAATLSYEVYTGSPLEIVRDYTAAAGRQPLPPPSQFALIKWRDAVDGPAQVLDDVTQLQQRSIPIGWVLLDNPWEPRGCKGRLTFDSTRFPDPKAMIAAVHARGVRFMLWVSPHVSLEDGCPDSGYEPDDLLGLREGEDPIDLTKGDAFDLFVAKLRSVFALGVDGVKGDRGDETQKPGDVQNRYPALYAKAVTEALGNRPYATLFRAGGPGANRFLPGFWAGDQIGDFRGLERAIRSGATAGIAGYPVWGSDTGGYASENLTPEVFVRWAQFSAVSPIFEVGGIGPNATFWRFGERTTGLFRDAAVLHYELFPYLYGLARTAARRGDPILQPLGLRYPAESKAWDYDRELLVGPDLLAAPVTDATRPRQVYIPSGTWVDVFTGRRVEGAVEYARPTPLSDFPLYLRAGATIPFNLREPDLWPKPWGVNDLDRPGRAGYLVAPDGARAVIDLPDAPRETQVLVLTRRRPRSVSIGGRTVPASSSDAALRGAPVGWTTKPFPFGGVLLKLRGPARAVVHF